MHEQQLIKALQGRDQAAFSYFVTTYQHLVYNTALGIIHDAGESEDVAQEVFMQVYESVGKFKGESKLSTWLYRITLTRALDWQRRKKRKKRFAGVLALLSTGGADDEVTVDVPDFHHPGVIAENKERAALLFAAIGRLPDNQKSAFVLNKVEGLSYQQVAEVLNVSVGAVESYLHRAKQNLRKELERYYRESND